MSALEEVQTASIHANDQGKEAQHSIASSYNSLNQGTYSYEDLRGSMVGMNTDEDTVNEMITGIDNYIAKVQENIDQMTNYEESAFNAFGPNVGTTVNGFVEAMKKSCSSVISQLNRFKDDIQIVVAAYRAKGESVVNVVTAQAGSVSSSATSNTYEYSGK